MEENPIISLFVSFFITVRRDRLRQNKPVFSPPAGGGEREYTFASLFIPLDKSTVDTY